MLYTIVPPEVIWQHVDEIKAPQEMAYLGQKLLVRPLREAGTFAIVQLLSSDPALFLREEFQPGTILRFPAAEPALE